MGQCNLNIRYRGRLLEINVVECCFDSITVIKGKSLKISDKDKKKLRKLAQKKINSATHCNFCF